MPKKSTDPFMSSLWSALIADELGPGGHRTGWPETDARIRNRFIRAVRQVLQSGAAFQASAIDLRITEKPAPQPRARKASAKRHDPRELQLPLMSSVQPEEKAEKKKSGQR